MSSVELYQQLSEAYQAQGKYQERDRFLVLAMDAAFASGQGALAEQIRRQLLELNPNHLIKPYASSKEALQAPNFANYLGQLRKNFPPAKAQSLLNDVSKTEVRRQPTLLAPEATFPMADPASDQGRPPAWSQIDIPRPPRPAAPRPAPPPPPVFSYTQEHAVPPLEPVADPLAHIPPPQHRQPPVDSTFRLAPADVPPARGPGPSRKATDEVYSSSGATIGNALFFLLLVASLVAFCWVFVLPLL